MLISLNNTAKFNVMEYRLFAWRNNQFFCSVEYSFHGCQILFAYFKLLLIFRHESCIFRSWIAKQHNPSWLSDKFLESQFPDQFAAGKLRYQYRTNRTCANIFWLLKVKINSFFIFYTYFLSWWSQKPF